MTEDWLPPKPALVVNNHGTRHLTRHPGDSRGLSTTWLGKLHYRTECSRLAETGHSNDPKDVDAVTCGSCRRTRRFKAMLASLSAPEEARRGRRS